MHTVFMSTGKTHDVMVVGGGAAGMMAALFCARGGAKVLLLERNEKLGKKVYITGKGRCNVTNVCPVDDFLQEVPCNPRFLHAALRFFSPQDLMELLEELHCPLKIERGNRVFPVSDKASDVTRALEHALQKAGVELHYHARVQKLICENGCVQGVLLENGQELFSSAVILATGGLSYPSTGSTGDGLLFAKDSGHALSPTRPALVPLNTVEEWPKALQGLSLKNVCLTAVQCGKMVFCQQGEMLFTHFGISGPLVLELSSHLKGNDMKAVSLALDLKPALDAEQLDARLQRELKQSGKRHVGSILQTLLPQSLALIFPELCGVSGDCQASQVTLAQRKRIVDTLKSVPITPHSFRSMSEAIITRGGVAVKDVSPSTMQSKHVCGLYFAGEMLDVDAHTGGFNLQIAFSTGALAGQSAALYAQSLT